MLQNYDFSKYTILIAEDEHTNYLLLEVLLKKTNAKLIWVQTGEDAVNAVKNNKDIDAVLMDVKMPCMNGDDATKVIKKHNPDLPIIAQTAYALSDDKNKIMDAGYDKYIPKPIEADTLFEILNEVLN